MTNAFLQCSPLAFNPLQNNIPPSPQHCASAKRKRDFSGISQPRTRRRIPETETESARRAVLKRKRNGMGEDKKLDRPPRVEALNQHVENLTLKQSKEGHDALIHTLLDVQAHALVASSLRQPPLTAQPFSLYGGTSPTVSVDLPVDLSNSDLDLPHLKLLSAPGAGQMVRVVPILNLEMLTRGGKERTARGELKSQEEPVLLEQVCDDWDGLPCFVTPGAKAMMERERIMELDEEVV